MTKYNKTLLAAIAISLFLGSQTAKATYSTSDWNVVPIENRTDQPIRIRVAFIGEQDWGLGNCTLCPDHYNIEPHSTKKIDVKLRQVTNIDFSDIHGGPSYGWTNVLSKDILSKLVFLDNKIRVEKDGKLVKDDKGNLVLGYHI